MTSYILNVCRLSIFCCNLFLLFLFLLAPDVCLYLPCDKIISLTNFATSKKKIYLYST